MRAVVWARMRCGIRCAASRSGLGGVWVPSTGTARRYRARSTLYLLSLNSNFCAGGQIGRAADRMASTSRFCAACCLITVKKLAFYRTEMTYKRGKTRSDDPLRASNQPMWKPKRPPSVRRAHVFDHPSEDWVPGQVCRVAPHAKEGAAFRSNLVSESGFGDPENCDDRCAFTSTLRASWRHCYNGPTTCANVKSESNRRKIRMLHA